MIQCRGQSKRLFETSWNLPDHFCPGCTFSLSELSKFRGDTLWDRGPGGVFQAQRNWCLSLLGRRKIKSSACKRNIYNLWSSAILQHTNQIHSRLTRQSHDLLSFLATTILRPETNLLQWDNQNNACISNSVPFCSGSALAAAWCLQYLLQPLDSRRSPGLGPPETLLHPQHPTSGCSAQGLTSCYICGIKDTQSSSTGCTY